MAISTPAVSRSHAPRFSCPIRSLWPLSSQPKRKKKLKYANRVGAGISELDAEPPATQPVLVIRIAALIAARVGIPHHDVIRRLKLALMAIPTFGARWIASQIPIATREISSR